MWRRAVHSSPRGATRAQTLGAADNFEGVQSYRLVVCDCHLVAQRRLKGAADNFEEVEEQIGKLREEMRAQGVMGDSDDEPGEVGGRLIRQRDRVKEAWQ